MIVKIQISLNSSDGNTHMLIYNKSRTLWNQIQAPEGYEEYMKGRPKAYFEGTLAPGNCMCCAVGNMCADAAGIDIRDEFDQLVGKPFHVDMGEKQRTIMNIWAGGMFTQERYMPANDLTGYSNQELYKIEEAFEHNTLININAYLDYTEQQILEDQYRGLCAVIDVLISFEPEAQEAQLWKDKMRHPSLQQ